MKYLVILLAILVTTPIYAQTRAYLSGKVEDINSKPLIGATLRVDGTAYGAITDRNGQFKIKSISVGKNKLLVSMIGYETKVIETVLKSNELNTINITLKEQAIETNEIVVSANKRIQTVQEIPISIGIISAQDMKSKNLTRLDDALEYVPGIEINKDNISVRGSSGFSFGLGSRVAVLIDGFPILSGDNGDAKADAIPVFDIERVEIVKGAGSALYGTGALGGVVNIISRQPSEQSSVRISPYIGFYTKPRYKQWEFSDSYQLTKGVELGTSQKLGNFSYLLTASFMKDDGYRYADEISRSNAFAKLSYSFSDFNQVSLTTNIATYDSHDWVFWKSLDSATFPSEDNTEDLKVRSDKMTVFADWRSIISDNIFTMLKTGVFFTSFENSLEKTDASYRQTDALNFNAEYQLNAKLSDGLQLTSGVNANINSVSSNIYGNRKQNSFAFYSQLEYVLNQFTFTGGARFDYEKTDTLDSEIEISPKLGLLYKTDFGMNLRASAGTGFRAPSIAERYASTGFSGFKVYPNFNLKAEKSFSTEIGANQQFEFLNSKCELDVSAFWNEMSDLIEPTFIDAGTAAIQFVNFQKARIIGTEISAKTFIAGLFGVESSLTIMDPRDLKTDSVLNYRSEILWYNKLIIPLGDFKIFLDYRYKSKVKNIDTRVALQVKDYDARVPMHIVDLSLAYNTKLYSALEWGIQLSVRNLFDYYFTEIMGNLYQTRNIVLQTSLKL